jgi:hypothetical protein
VVLPAIVDDTDSYDARPFKIARSTLDFALREKAVRLHVTERLKEKAPAGERGRFTSRC